MLYFDLDGVIRNLNTPVYGSDPDFYGQPINGKNFIDYVNDGRIDILTKAPMTEFAEIIISMHKKYNQTLNIYTYQIPSWRPSTTSWILDNLKGIGKSVKFANTAAEKPNHLKKDDTLVEDFPYFNDYSQIVLINHKYNTGTPVKTRINTPKDMELFLACHFALTPNR